MERQDIRNAPNDVNGSCVATPGASSGRVDVSQQASLGRHPDTASAERTDVGGGRRQKWSVSDNRMVVYCYVKSRPERRGYRKRMHELWVENGMRNVSEQRLADQVRVIKKNEWFSAVEFEEMREMIEREEAAELARESENEEMNEIQEGTPIEVTEDAVQDQVQEEVHENEGADGSDNRNDEEEVEVQFGPLREEEIEVIEMLRRVAESASKVRLPSLSGVASSKLKDATEKVNRVLGFVRVDSLSELNDLLYAAAKVVTELVGIKCREVAGGTEEKRANEAGWKRRLDTKLIRLRKDMGRLKEWKRGMLKNEKVQKSLSRRYCVLELGLVVVIEQVRQKIVVVTGKLRRFEERIKQFQQNKMFEVNERQVYRDLRGEEKGQEMQHPDAEEAIGFWEEIWSNPGQIRGEAEWIRSVKEEMSGLEQQQDVVIGLDDVKRYLGRMPLWKAPGPEWVQWYWLKKMSSLHSGIVIFLNRLLRTGDVPLWLVTGRTLLLQKDRAKGTVPGNYRPITCLPVMWKLFTGVLGDYVYKHLDEAELLVDEQKGCRKKSRGTKDQVIIDKAVMEDCRRRQRDLAMVWVDYRKAYDMVPHEWIEKCLDLCGVAKNVSDVLLSSMNRWRVQLNSGNRMLGEVRIRRGIFQGDSLSPLLFVMCLVPLTFVLRKMVVGYRFGKDNVKVNHLFFMDDLKLYARRDKEVESLLHTVRVCSADFGMEFGVAKCAQVIVKRGKVVLSDGIELPDGQVIRGLDAGDSYRYLGFAECFGICQAEAKNAVLKEYKYRVRRVLKSSLNGRNCIQAINTWAVSLFRYSGGIVKWGINELKSVDVQTRKLLCMHGALHPRADVDRLYVPRRMGGRGLMSIADVVSCEVSSLCRYVESSSEPLLLAAAGVLWSGDNTPPEVKLEDMQRKRYEGWSNKCMHGQYLKLVNGSGSEMWDWLRMSGLKKATEGLLIAAQDQALPTNVMKSRVYGTGGDPKCRMCGRADETIMHLLCECSVLASRDYKLRHDTVAKYVHWSLAVRCGFQCCSKWYEHVPENVMENDGCRLFWDSIIMCDRFIEHRRPDIVLYDLVQRKVFIIDIAVPGDGRVGSKEREKKEKYLFLADELKKLWNVSACVVPVVVGCLGCLGPCLQESLLLLKVKCSVVEIQKAALLGSARILRKCLSL